jgi:hypothetical protein
MTFGMPMPLQDPSWWNDENHFKAAHLGLANQNKFYEFLPFPGELHCGYFQFLWWSIAQFQR